MRWRWAAMYTSRKSREFLLPIAGSLYLLVLDDFNPVAIRVKNEGNVLHATVCQALLPTYSLVVETLARGVKIIYRDTYRNVLVFHCALLEEGLFTDVSEALWF